jgi:hypothetical protein
MRILTINFHLIPAANDERAHLHMHAHTYSYLQQNTAAMNAPALSAGALRVTVHEASGLAASQPDDDGVVVTNPFAAVALGSVMHTTQVRTATSCFLFLFVIVLLLLRYVVLHHVTRPFCVAPERVHNSHFRLLCNVTLQIALRTTQPQWQQEFVFTARDVKREQLLVRIHDWKRYAADGDVGRVVVPLAPLLSLQHGRALDGSVSLTRSYALSASNPFARVNNNGGSNGNSGGGGGVVALHDLATLAADHCGDVRITLELSPDPTLSQSPILTAGFMYVTIHQVSQQTFSNNHCPLLFSVTQLHALCFVFYSYSQISFILILILNSFLFSFLFVGNGGARGRDGAAAVCCTAHGRRRGGR